MDECMTMMMMMMEAQEMNESKNPNLKIYFLIKRKQSLISPTVGR